MTETDTRHGGLEVEVILNRLLLCEIFIIENIIKVLSVRYFYTLVLISISELSVTKNVV